MTNHGIDVIRRRRPLWPPARAIAGIIAAASVALLATACGGSTAPGPASAGSPNGPASAGPLAFSQCMRSQGIPDFPDPGGGGSIPKETAQELGVSDSQFQAAQTTCGHLLPSADQPGPPSQAELRLAWSDSLKFAGCMRSHGVRDWPEPGSGALHPERPAFNLQLVGIDPNWPQITARIRDCAPLLRGWAPYVITAAGQNFLAGA
jgi:hypothetical protein